MLARKGIQGVSGSPTPEARGSQVESPRMNAPGFEIMLPSPAAPHQYETVHEPEDELQTANELTLPEPRHHPGKKFTTVSRERPTHPPAPKIITPVPLPKTATLPQRTPTPQPRSGTLTPGSKPRNKGRPKGWRPGMSYTAVRNFGPEVAAKFAAMNPVGNRQAGTAKLAKLGSGRGTRKTRAAASAPGTQAIKKTKARPAVTAPAAPPPPTPPMKIYMERGVKDVPFRCEWRGCSSRLHNLKTLEKHVDIVHCRGERNECLWRRCADAEISFDTEEELEAHLKEAHFIPYAWHFGDGPKISFGTPEPDLEKLPDYLFDKTGKQVTDSIKEQVEEDQETRDKREKWLEDFLKKGKVVVPYEVNSEDEDEAMVLGWSSAYP